MPIPYHFFIFIAFEACFMTGVEGLYELKDKTDYILGSSAEKVTPGFVPAFPASLRLLYRPQADLVGFVRDYSISGTTKPETNVRRLLQ